MANFEQSRVNCMTPSWLIAQSYTYYIKDELCSCQLIQRPALIVPSLETIIEEDEIILETPEPEIELPVPSVLQNPEIDPPLPSVLHNPEIDPPVSSVVPNPEIDPPVPSVLHNPEIDPLVSSVVHNPKIDPPVPSVVHNPEILDLICCPARLQLYLRLPTIVEMPGELSDEDEDSDDSDNSSRFNGTTSEYGESSTTKLSIRFANILQIEEDDVTEMESISGMVASVVFQESGPSDVSDSDDDFVRDKKFIPSKNKTDQKTDTEPNGNIRGPENVRFVQPNRPSTSSSNFLQVPSFYNEPFSREHIPDRGYTRDTLHANPFGIRYADTQHEPAHRILPFFIDHSSGIDINVIPPDSDENDPFLEELRIIQRELENDDDDSEYDGEDTIVTLSLSLRVQRSENQHRILERLIENLTQIGFNTVEDTTHFEDFDDFQDEASNYPQRIVQFEHVMREDVSVIEVIRQATTRHAWGLIRRNVDFGHFNLETLATEVIQMKQELPLPLIKETKVKKATREDTALTCIICLENYEIRDDVKYLHCKHHFHNSCISRWLLQRGTCPICRSELFIRTPSPSTFRRTVFLNSDWYDDVIFNDLLPMEEYISENQMSSHARSQETNVVINITETEENGSAIHFYIHIDLDGIPAPTEDEIAQPPQPVRRQMSRPVENSPSVARMNIDAQLQALADRYHLSLPSTSQGFRPQIFPPEYLISPEPPTPQLQHQSVDSEQTESVEVIESEPTTDVAEFRTNINEDE